MFSFFVQQQVAQTLQHLNRLFIRHGDGDQQGRGFPGGIEWRGRTADGDSAAQVAFSTVVQPDALAEVQRFVINGVSHEGGIHGTGLFQATGVERLQGHQVGSHHVEGQRVVIQLQGFALLFAHQQGAQLFSGGSGLQLFSHGVVAQDVRQLTQQAEVFIAAGGNPNGDIGYLAFAPEHALRELIDLNAGFQHLIAGIGGAMRNGDAIAKEG